MTLTPEAPARIAYYNEGDLWRWQLEALADLTAFVRAHAPGTERALPAVPWRVDNGREVSADVGFLIDPATGKPRDPVAVLTAYAAALKVEVERTEFPDQTSYLVKALIGRPQGTRARPRTTCALFARIYRDLDAVT